MKKKKEFAIGEEFQLGLKRFRVYENKIPIDQYDACLFCAFQENYCKNIKEYTGECFASCRIDGKNVIFKEIRKK